MLQIARLRTWSDATLGREVKPIPSPESPRQVNAGARVQAVRCHCAGALKYDALRPFWRDGVLVSGLKALELPPIQARPSVSRVQMSVWCFVLMYIPPSVQTDKWCFGVGNAPFVLYAGRFRSATAPIGRHTDEVFCRSGLMCQHLELRRSTAILGSA